MQCISCGSQLESNWTHCPFCGNFKSVLQEPVTDEHVNSIFEKMFDRRMGSKEGAYGSGVRGQVFEVIVRQAMAGAPWRQICEGPMAVNKISVAEVLAEVDRRRKMGGPSSFKKSKDEKAKMDKEFKKVKETKETKESKELKGAEIHKIEEAKSFFSNQASQDNKDYSTPPRPQPSSKPELNDSATVRLQKLQKQLEEFLENAISDKDKKQYSDKMMSELNEIANSIMRLETLLHSIQKEISITRDLERELGRTKKPINPDQPGDPHRIDW